MAVEVRDFLKARRDRALGTILGYAEREVYGSLTRDEQQAFRGLVMEAINGYHDAVLDLVKSDSGDVHNEEILDLLRRLDRSMKPTVAPRL